MAFDATKITKICNLFSVEATTDPTPGLFFYRSTDTLAVMAAANYFNGYAGFLIEGAYIWAHGADGNRVFHVVSSVNGVVTVNQAGSKTVSGQATTVTAVDTIDTGLSLVTSVVAIFDSDIGDNPEWVTASKGDQAGAPLAGKFLLKTWQNTAGNDPTPVAATTFGKKVNWIAVGAG